MLVLTQIKEGHVPACRLYETPFRMLDAQHFDPVPEFVPALGVGKCGDKKAFPSQGTASFGAVPIQCNRLAA